MTTDQIQQLISRGRAQADRHEARKATALAHLRGDHVAHATTPGGDPLAHGNGTVKGRMFGKTRTLAADYEAAVKAIGDALYLLESCSEGDAVDARALLRHAYAEAKGSSDRA